MAHFRTWVRWGRVSHAIHDGEEEQMRLACHTALDDLLRDMQRKHVTPQTDGDYRKLELIVNAGAE